MNRLFIIVFCVIALSCGKRIKDGKVVDKYWYDSYTSLIPIGKTLMPMYHPKRYCVKIMKVVNNDTVKNEINMYKDEWDTTYVGEHISFK